MRSTRSMRPKVCEIGILRNLVIDVRLKGITAVALVTERPSLHTVKGLPANEEDTQWIAWYPIGSQECACIIVALMLIKRRPMMIKSRVLERKIDERGEIGIFA